MCVQRRAISISYDRAPVLRGTTRRRRSPLWPVAGEQTGIECARAERRVDRSLSRATDRRLPYVLWRCIPRRLPHELRR